MRSLIILHALNHITIYNNDGEERHIMVPQESREERKQFIRNLFGDDIADRLLKVLLSEVRIPNSHETWIGNIAVQTEKDIINCDVKQATENMFRTISDRGELIEAEHRAKETIMGIESSIKGKESQVETPNKKNKSNTIKLNFNTEVANSSAKAPVVNNTSKTSLDNIITLKDLCIEVNIDPGKARRILRKNEDRYKINGKWEWDLKSDILKEIRGLLK
jgi:hypothetical protein